MKNKILNERNKDPFWLIRNMPDMPLFKDCPVKPPEKTINAAEEIYLRLGEQPTYISAYDEQVILEWHYYRNNGIKKELYYTKELVIKDAINMEWRTYNY